MTNVTFNFNHSLTDLTNSQHNRNFKTMYEKWLFEIYTNTQTIYKHMSIKGDKVLWRQRQTDKIFYFCRKTTIKMRERRHPNNNKPSKCPVITNTTWIKSLWDIVLFPQSAFVCGLSLSLSLYFNLSHNNVGNVKLQISNRACSCLALWY